MEDAIKYYEDKSEFRGYHGKDNYGKPKMDYIKNIIAKTDEELFEECKSTIWLSAYAANNPRSDYHWHCDVCYDESVRRGSGIYKQAYDKVYKDEFGG